MEKYCVNDRNESLNKIKENNNSFHKYQNDRTSTSKIKECFTEYSLEDKVEALKNVLKYNEIYKQSGSASINNIPNIKKIIGVKECLYANQETPFQTLISELRNTVMNSYWNQEVGKTRFQVPNLPIGMNSLEVTFGKKVESGESLAELLKGTVDKSHCSYLPAEQMERHYKEPFNKNLCFGKPNNSGVGSKRVKKLLAWINVDSHTVVSSKLANFLEHSRSKIGKVRNFKGAQIYTDIVHGKPNEKKEQEIMYCLNECPINNETLMQYNYLEYINNLRLNLKKRIPEIPFADIFEDLICFDEDYTELLPENRVFSTLAKYKIYINKNILIPLLELLKIRKEDHINYKALLNLLNWKYDFPTLPKIEKLPLKCQYYNSTYNDTIGNMKNMNITNIPTIRMSFENGDHKTTAYSLIFPNIFTRYGLSHIELSKQRSKEEIKSIFENAGIEIPSNTFNFLWEKGLEKNGTGNLSIEVFKYLFDQYNIGINDERY